MEEKHMLLELDFDEYFIKAGSEPGKEIKVLKKGKDISKSVQGIIINKFIEEKMRS